MKKGKSTPVQPDLPRTDMEGVGLPSTSQQKTRDFYERINVNEKNLEGTPQGEWD